MLLRNIPGIYKWTNLKNGKIYIGSAISLKHRYLSHLSSLRNNKHYSREFQNSFNKHGKENFKFEILELVQRLENEDENSFRKRLAKDREQYYLDTLLFASENNNRFNELGYNFHRKAQHGFGNKLKKHSEVTNERKRKAANKWYKDNPEAKKRRDKNKSLNWWSQEEFKCAFCDRFLKKSLIKRHSRVCLRNPNRVTYFLKKKNGKTNNRSLS